MRVRTIVLALTLACVTWFLAFQDGSVAAASQRAADLIDGRPARSILIIGNSRTFVNDMRIPTGVPVTIHDGDLIKIGLISFKAQFD